MPWSQGLTSYWRGEGTTLDASGNGNTGTAYDVGYTTAALGQGFSVTQAESIVIPTPAIPLHGPFTVAVWVKYTQITNYIPLYCQYCAGDSNRFFFSVLYTHCIRFQIGGSGFDSDAKDSIPLGSWRHITVVRETNDSMRIYISGCLVKSRKGVAGVKQGYARIAAAPGLELAPFSAIIDEVAVWSRALSVRDIRRVMMGMSPIE